MTDIKGIDHIAIVVEDLEEALKFWRDRLGLALDHIETVSSQGVKIAFLPVGNSEVELIQPLDDKSGVAKYLRKKGPGMHHLCFEVEDIQERLRDLESQGVRLIDQEPHVMDDGRKLAFLHPKSASGVLIELYELP
ncbi:MAG: methylmalonyl-CoA epimerase [Anaerolineales bacterium]|nr:methylmalonyl-CoA epimerase [Anaerolineales bacterium]